jgi:hypothetical protein
MMELLKDMDDTAKTAKGTDKLRVIPEEEAEEKDELYSNEDLQIIINQKEIKKSRCYKLPEQKVIIK